MLLFQICIELCDVLAKTVDGAKTGYRPDIKKEYQLKATPDFMEGKGECYESKRALGYLYRQATRFEDIVNHSTSIRDRSRISEPSRLEAWSYFHNRMESLKAKYRLHEDIELLACQVEMYDERQNLGKDLSDTYKEVRSRILDHKQDTEFQRGCASLVSCHSESTLVLAFSHLCLSCGINVVSIPAVMKPDSLIDSIWEVLPSRLPDDLATLKLSDEDKAILSCNPWALVTAGVLVLKCEQYPVCLQEALRHLFKVGKGRRYFQTPKQESWSIGESLQNMMSSVMKSRDQPQDRKLKNAYKEVKSSSAKTKLLPVQSKIRSSLLLCLLHVYLREEHHKPQESKYILRNIKQALCDIIERNQVNK